MSLLTRLFNQIGALFLFLKDPTFQLIAGILSSLLALLLIQTIFLDSPSLYTKWALVAGVGLFALFVVLAYVYLLVGKYTKNTYNMRFVWSVQTLKFLSAAIFILLFVVTYLASMASGYQLGGLLVPWMEILITMLAILIIPAFSYWATVNLQQTFDKKYAWISLYIHLLPLAAVLAMVHSSGLLYELSVWLWSYLDI